MFTYGMFGFCNFIILQFGTKQWNSEVKYMFLHKIRIYSIYDKNYIYSLLGLCYWFLTLRLKYTCNSQNEVVPC